MLIRRAENRDITQINNLLKQVCLVHHKGRPDLFKKGARKYSDDQLMQIIKDDNRPIFVAVDNNEVVLGYVFCIFEQYLDSNILTDVKTLYIDDLCVDENARGKKVGTSLYNYVLQFAKDAGCYNVTLNVWACNNSALKFYEKCGLSVQKIGLEKIL